MRITTLINEIKKTQRDLDSDKFSAGSENMMMSYIERSKKELNEEINYSLKNHTFSETILAVYEEVLNLKYRWYNDAELFIALMDRVEKMKLIQLVWENKFDEAKAILEKQIKE